MSLRRHVLRLVVLATAVAVCFSAFAGIASAKKSYTAKQKAAIRKQLKKQIRRNPAVIKRKSFVRKAALVNFVLPVTIRLRNQCAPGVAGQAACAGGAYNSPTNGTALNQENVPQANVNLGPSLGSRTVALSGSLAAEVQFNDTYDGGSLGNVAIKILPSTTKVLRSSSVPLLWNPDVTTTANTRSDRNFAQAAVRANAPLALSGALDSAVLNGKIQGCGDFTNATDSTRNLIDAPPVVGAGIGAPLSPNQQGAYNALWYGTSAGAYPFPGTQGGLPGYPVYNPAATAAPAYFLPVFPGIDDPTGIVAGGNYSNLTANNDAVGPNPNPFPYLATSKPGSATYNASDTVLRTNALSLSIAPAGVQVDGATGTSNGTGVGVLTNGPQGTQSFITGQSGGQANLFGNIPGKADAIDVTVNLRTTINSIFRIVDQDVFDTPLIYHQAWPAGIFNCRQIWSGAVQNYIPGVRLKGSLRIAPAITKDGKLRIAKATVATSQDTHLALSACLQPYRSYGADAAPGYPTSTTLRPGGLPTGGGGAPSPALPLYGQLGTTPGAGQPVAYNDTSLPFVNSESAAPSNVPCNATATPLVRNSGLTGTVESQTGINNLSDGYSSSLDGSQATVAGDISLQNLDVDVLIGDN